MSTANAHIMQNSPIVISAATHSQQHRPRNLRSMKCLAITQLLIGILVTVIGIAAMATLYARIYSMQSGAGIWAGIWITLTGLVGVCLCFCRRTSCDQNCVTCLYIALCIISTIVSVIAGFFFAVTILLTIGGSSLCEEYKDVKIWGGMNVFSTECNDKNVVLGLHSALLLFVLIEFFVSIVASCFGCNGCCCCAQPAASANHQPYMPVHTTSGAPAGEGHATVQYSAPTV